MNSTISPPPSQSTSPIEIDLSEDTGFHVSIYTKDIYYKYRQQFESTSSRTSQYHLKILSRLLFLVPTNLCM